MKAKRYYSPLSCLWSLPVAKQQQTYNSTYKTFLQLVKEAGSLHPSSARWMDDGDLSRRMKTWTSIGDDELKMGIPENPPDSRRQKQVFK